MGGVIERMPGPAGEVRRTFPLSPDEVADCCGLPATFTAEEERQIRSERVCERCGSRRRGFLNREWRGKCPTCEGTALVAPPTLYAGDDVESAEMGIGEWMPPDDGDEFEEAVA